MRLTKPQLLALRDKCLSVSDTTTGGDNEKSRSSSGYRLTRVNFLNAMTELNVEFEPDYQILDKLFVMWDCDGVDWVDLVSNILQLPVCLESLRSKPTCPSLNGSYSLVMPIQA